MELSRKRHRRLVAIVLVAVLAASAALAVRARSVGIARQREGAIRAALAEHRLDEARRQIDCWAAAAPEDGAAHYYRARLEVASDRPVEAMNAMRAALERGFPDGPILTLRAVLQARAGQCDEAEPILQAALKDADLRAEVAEGLTLVYVGSYRLPEASKALVLWKEAAPEDARPYTWQNEVDERLGAEPSVLIHNDRQALRRAPGLLDVRLHLADLLLKTHRVDEAEVEYAALLARDPDNVGAHDGVGRVALLSGDLPAAIRHFTEALARNGNDPVALRELALIDLRQGRYDSSVARFKKVVAIEPFDVEVRYSYARALRTVGDASQAALEDAYASRLRDEQQRINELRQALVRRPEDEDLQFEVARWLIEHGHENEGLKWAERILQQRPGHAKASHLLAEYHARKGNPGRANFYRAAASSLPGSSSP